MGELTHSQHVVKAKDVHVGINKSKLMFVLRSSKTQGADKKPEMIKICSLFQGTRDEYSNFWSRTNTAGIYCLYVLTRNYLRVQNRYQSMEEQFFIFQDCTPVKPTNFRKVLNLALQKAGFNHKNYGTHSLHAGRSLDLLRLGFSVETIKKLGRWSSNSVYTYLK